MSNTKKSTVDLLVKFALSLSTIASQLRIVAGAMDENTSSKITGDWKKKIVEGEPTMMDKLLVIQLPDEKHPGGGYMVYETLAQEQRAWWSALMKETIGFSPTDIKN